MSPRKPKPQDPNHPEQDVVGASRVLAEAVSAFTRALAGNVSEEVNAQVLAVSRELTEASQRLSRDVGAARQTRAEATRASLIESATRLFAEKGYGSASLGDVATAAGFTKGAVYSNFANKEQLLREVVRVAAEREEQGPLEELALDDDSRLAGLLDAEVALHLAREEYLRDLAEFSEAATERLARRVAERAGRPEPTEEDWDTARAIIAVRTQAYAVVTAGGDPAPYNRILARLLG